MIRKDKARDYVRNGLIKHPKFAQAKALRHEIADIIVKKCEDALTDREREYIKAGYSYRKQSGLDYWSFSRLVRWKGETINSSFSRVNDCYTSAKELDWLGYFRIDIPAGTPYIYNFGSYDRDNYLENEEFINSFYDKAKQLWNLINEDLKEYAIQTFAKLTSESYTREKLEKEHPELLCEN